MIVMKAILLVATFASIILVQSPSTVGHFKGIVRDVKGSRINEASITVEGTDFHQRLRSKRSGRFELDLPPGTYRITVEKSGFANYELTELVI